MGPQYTKSHTSDLLWGQVRRSTCKLSSSRSALLGHLSISIQVNKSPNTPYRNKTTWEKEEKGLKPTDPTKAHKDQSQGRCSCRSSSRSTSYVGPRQRETPRGDCIPSRRHSNEWYTGKLNLDLFTFRLWLSTLLILSFFFSSLLLSFFKLMFFTTK